MKTPWNCVVSIRTGHKSFLRKYFALQYKYGERPGAFEVLLFDLLTDSLIPPQTAVALNFAHMKSLFLERLHSPQRPVLVFDGAMGTNIQSQDLSLEDFGEIGRASCRERV